MTRDPVVDPALRLAAIVESSDDAIISKSLNGIITTWNQGAERIFGYPAEEVVGKHISILLPPERKDDQSQILARIAEGERVEPFETVRRRRDGSLVDISLTVSPIMGANGQVIGASKIARDITEQNRERELRRHSEELFRVTLESIADAVVATDLDAHVTFMNPVAEQLTGWRSRDAAARPLEEVFQIVSETTHQVIAGPVPKVLATGSVVGHENDTILIAKDGTRRPIDHSAAPIRSSSEDMFGVVLLFRDVTEQRGRAFMAERLAAIVSNSSDAIYTVALEQEVSAIGIVRTWNRAAEALYGFPADEIIGRPLALIIPTDLHLAEMEILARLRRGESVAPHESRRVTKGGKEIRVLVSSSPLRDVRGRLIGVSKIDREVALPLRPK